MANIPLPLERNLYLADQVNQSSINEIIKNIINIQDNDIYLKKLYNVYDITYTPKPIKIHIDSYGGNVYQCLGLISVMEKCTTPIHTIVTGCAMSAGFIILISGHRRFAHKYSTPLYHQVSSWEGGKLKDLKENLSEVERLQETLEQITLKKTKITKNQLKDIFVRKVDWYMSSEEALNLKVIDEII